MKKYILIFAVSSCFGISHAVAQSRAATTQQQAVAITVTDSTGKQSTGSHGTISKAGKNQQSVYTPPASGTDNNTSGSGTPPQQASPDKGQPATIAPKK